MKNNKKNKEGPIRIKADCGILLKVIHYFTKQYISKMNVPNGFSVLLYAELSIHLDCVRRNRCECCWNVGTIVVLLDSTEHKRK